MTRTERYAKTYRQAYDGPAWHGPALKQILEGITAAMAAKHPPGGGHSIWEIVSHIRAWDVIIRRRLAGEVIIEVDDEVDWPPVRDTSEAAWSAMQDALFRGANELADAIAAVPETRLTEKMPQRQHSRLTEILGGIQHTVYHSGQVAVLKRIVA